MRDLTDDEAVIIMVDSNLQRERVLPSEKAFAYKMKLDAMRRQGQRTDLTSTPVVEKLKGKDALSSAIVGKTSGDSYEQVRRFIRLTNLIPEILDMVDDGRIAFRPAVELSYLAEQEQCALYDTMGREDCTPSLAQAIKMKAFSRDGKLTDAVILSIMEEEKPNQKDTQGAYQQIFQAGDARTDYGGYDHQGTGLLQKAAAGNGTLNLPPRGKSAHRTGCVPGLVFPLPPLHTSPPSYRLYRLKKRFPYKSISYRKQHPFPDGAFYFYS